MYPSGTSLSYSSFSTSNFRPTFSISCLASSCDSPTTLGIYTSGGFVIFKNTIVPHKLITNNNIKPIIELKT